RFTSQLRDQYGAVFAPDGSTILTVGDTGGNDVRVHGWDAATGQELHHLGGETALVRRAVFSPDGKRAVTASDDGTARVWDAASGQELLRFTGHAGAITTVAFAPDGRSVVTGGDDKTARIWDPFTGKES